MLWGKKSCLVVVLLHHVARGLIIVAALWGEEEIIDGEVHDTTNHDIKEYPLPHGTLGIIGIFICSFGHFLFCHTPIIPWTETVVKRDVGEYTGLSMDTYENRETATFAGGCFWCTEAIFKRLKGVMSVVPGYTGGNPPTDGANPSYDAVSSGITGHAEATQIVFDPNLVTFDTLLTIFFATHNPTTRNQQGNDVGTQYRSAIFYHNQEQKEQALAAVKQLTQKMVYQSPIVTEIVPLTQFYPAESYHANYFDKNTTAPYCMFVISPKIQKLLKEYGDVVKDEYKGNPL